MIEINTTQLLRRIRRYLDNHCGGRAQTGETALGLAACGDAAFVKHLREGRAIQPYRLERMSKYLSGEGY